MIGFAQVLDSVDRLSLDEQEQIGEMLRRRVAEKRRAELVAALKEARQEFAAGKIKASGATAILHKIMK